MIRRLWIFCLALCPVLCFSTNRAVLVSVSDYRVLHQSQLSAGDRDLALMSAMAKGFGCSPLTLSQSAAKKSAVEAAMATLADSCGRGDQALFYFSGRGAWAAEAPSIAPYDALKDDGGNDIPVSEIQSWAEKVASKGATPVVILDCCWQPIESSKALTEARPWKHEAKFFPRTGQHESKLLYSGPGLFLSAADAGGLAYEWEIGDNQFASAFTHMLTTSVTDAWIRQEPLSSADLIEDVQTEARRLTRQDYMPLYQPYESGKGDEPFFGGNFQLQSQGALGLLLQKQREQAKTFRIAVDIDPAVTDHDGRIALKDAVDEYLAGARFPELAFLRNSASMPDMVLEFGRGPGGYSVKIVDDEQGLADDDPIIPEGSRTATYKGESLGAILQGGLQDKLRTYAYMFRLLHLARLQPNTSKARLAIALQPEYKLGEAFPCVLSSSASGVAYVFNYSAGASVAQFVSVLKGAAFPSVQANKPAPLLLDEKGAASSIDTASEPGTCYLMTIFVEKNKVLPPLDTKSDDFVSKRLEHLKALCDNLTNGSVKWAALRQRYEILNQRN